MKYNEFPHDESFRSLYFWKDYGKKTSLSELIEVHKYRISVFETWIKEIEDDEELTQEDLHDKNKLKSEISQIEKEIIEIRNFIPKEKSELIKPKLNNKPSYDQINFFDYSIYIKKKYPDLTDLEKKVLIYKSTSSLEEYLDLFNEIIFKREYIMDELGRVTLDEDDKEKYLLKRQENEIENFFEAVKLGLFFIDVVNLIEEDYELRESSRFKYYIHHQKMTNDDFNKYSLFFISQYEVLLKNVLYSEKEIEELDNQLLKIIKSLNPDFYSILKKCIDHKIIFIEKEKLNFPYSLTTIATLFKINKYTKWSLISKYILSNGDKPTKSFGKTEEQPDTSEYKQLNSKINNIF